MPAHEASGWDPWTHCWTVFLTHATGYHWQFDLWIYRNF